jgi:hypothetical protein
VHVCVHFDREIGLHEKGYRYPAPKSIDAPWPGRCEKGHTHATGCRLIRRRYARWAEDPQPGQESGRSVVVLGSRGPQLPTLARAVKVRGTKSLPSVDSRT